MSIHQLKKKIAQKEQEIRATKTVIYQKYGQVKKEVRDVITSPSALLTAFSLSFLITYYSPHQKLKLSQLTEHFLTAKNLFLLLV